jgi:hypothetical protein
MGRMSESIIALELAEIEAFTDLYRAASPEVVAASGLSVTQVGDAVLMAMNRVDVLALNRLVGLGLRSSPSDAALANAVNALEQTGAPRCFVPVAPTGASEDLGVRLERRGLQHYNNWMRLRRRLDDLPPGPSSANSLDVRRIGSAEARVFGHLVATAFGYPPAIAPIASQTIGRPHCAPLQGVRRRHTYRVGCDVHRRRRGMVWFRSDRCGASKTRRSAGSHPPSPRGRG